jgi:hypothetical protein
MLLEMVFFPTVWAMPIGLLLSLVVLLDWLPLFELVYLLVELPYLVFEF